MSKQRTAAWCAAMCAFALTSTGALAAPPTVTLAINAPTDMDNKAQDGITLDYTVVGGDLADVSIVYTLPEGFSVLDTAAPPAFSNTSSACVNTVGGGVPLQQVCTFTAPTLVAGAGLSGQIVLTVRAGGFVFSEGATATHAAALNATYDDGTVQALPVVNANATQTMHGAVNIIFNESITTVISENNDVGDPGVSFTVRVDQDFWNIGNNQLEGGWNVTFAPAAPLQFVSWSPASAPGPYTETSAPTPYTIGNLVLNHAAVLGEDIGSQYGYLAPHVFVKLWVACTDLPLATGSRTWTVSGTEVVNGASVAYTKDLVVDNVPVSFAGSCGSGTGVAAKSSNPTNEVGELTPITWSLAMQPPIGVYPASNTAIVDAIPPEVDLTGLVAHSPAEFTPHYCTIPSEEGNTFDAATFTSTHQSANCSTTAPADLTTVTHIVYYAATWGTSSSIDNFTASYTALPVTGLADQTTATNTARMTTGSGADVTATDPVIIRTAAFLNSFMFSTKNAVERGETWEIKPTFGSTAAGVFARNPTVTVTLPAGVNYISSNVRPFDSFPCAWPAPYAPTVWDAQPAVTAGGGGETILTWTFGDAANPAYLINICGNGGTNKPLHIPINVQADANYPFVNGQTLTMVAVITAENAVQPSTWNRPVTVQVPAEMKVDVAGACSGTGEQAFDIAYENTGGEELTNVTVAFEIPQAGTNGTEVDTVFASLTPPSGTTLEYSADGTNWQGTPTTPVAWVRVTIASIQPYEPAGTFQVVLDAPTGVGGDQMFGVATIDANELGAVTSSISTPTVVGACPGDLTVHIFFDTNNNGVQDPGEPDLENWPVDVTDDGNGGSSVGTGTTDSDGDDDYSLPPGDYTGSTSTPASDPEATWNGSTSGSGTVTEGGSTTINIGVSCTCDDGDTCTDDVCNIDGTCTFTGNGGTSSTDGTCDGVDDDCDGSTDEDYAPTATTCGVGACASTGVTSCALGTESDSCVEGTAAADDQTCDGVDDDCSGEADEDFVGTATTCGVGACAATGTTTCVAGTPGDSCTAGTAAADDATCDGVDDDCDGSDDEDYIETATTCGSGACAATGTLQCLGGTPTDSCSAGSGAADDATCDGTDDDCDGFTDEDYVASATNCGVGTCAATGTLECLSGVETDSCTPSAAGSGADTVCDGLDEDCDGTADEDVVGLGDVCTNGDGQCGAGGVQVCATDGSGGLECDGDATVNNGNVCDDGDACTSADACVDGVCTGNGGGGTGTLVIACPAAPAAVECSGAATDVTVEAATATGGCGNVTISDDAPASGYPSGTTTVTFSASDDASAATDECTVDVVVEDTTAPTITCPADVAAALDDTCGASVSLEAATTDDSCDAAGVAVSNDAPTSYTVGDTTVTFTATDAAGNTASCTTTVTVTKPATGLVCPDPVTHDLAADSCVLSQSFTAQYVNACVLTAEVSTDTNDYPPGVHDVDFAFDDKSADAPYTCQTQVTINDVTDPVVDCNLPTIPAEGIAAPTTVFPSGTDVCGVAITTANGTCVDESGETVECVIEHIDGGIRVVSVEGDGNVTVQFDAVGTDPSGNVSSVPCELPLVPPSLTPTDECQPGWVLNEDGICDLIRAHGGGGCESGDSGAPIWFGLALMLLVLWRRRRSGGAVVAAAVIATALVVTPMSDAKAQQGNVPAQLFEPAPGGALNYVRRMLASSESTPPRRPR